MSVEPGVDEGCCNRQKGPCQAQPCSVWRLETSSNCPLHGPCALELDYAACPAWPGLGLESPARPLVLWSPALTSELTAKPFVQVGWCLQEVLQLVDALLGF